MVRMFSFVRGVAVALTLATASDCCAQQRAQSEGTRPELPEPDHANVSYGPHERNVIDLWLAEADTPTPLVIYIHGGGFRGGDKKLLSAGLLRQFRDAGVSVAAINYRLTNVAPFPAAHHDSARAVQFLRHHAQEWNLDKMRFGATGFSAGAEVSLWLAFHDDLTDPESDDPIEQESTRLNCVAVSNGQSSYDPRFCREIGLPGIERHASFLPFYGITRDEIDTPRAHELYEEAAAITHLTADDDVPVLMTYSRGDVPIDNETSIGVITHHPKFGIDLKKRMNELGLECIVTYRDQPGERPRVSIGSFLQSHLLNRNE